MAAFTDLQQEVARVTAATGQSVVVVGRDGRGGGVVVADGYVLTNAHNLRGTEITVTFAGGRRVTGSVRGVDRDGDLAVVGVDTGDAPVPVWADGGPGAGTVVYGVARASGGSPRVTAGMVSAVDQAFRGPQGRLVHQAFEHTAPLGRGSSGTPVVDGEGRLVGLNTHRLGDGFYLAVPAGPELRSRVDALTSGVSPQRLHLGVALVPPHVAGRMRASVGLPPHDGLLVRGVEPGGPAATAGVAAGDLLVEAGGTVLASIDDLHTVLAGHDPAATLEVRLLRGAEEISVSIAFPTG
jgi:serine protease Do